MATAQHWMDHLCNSVPGHMELPLATSGFSGFFYYENQTTEHFMGPTTLKRKISGCLHGTCKCFLFL